MAIVKRILTDSIQKHDIEFNWSKAVNFIPDKGMIVIYGRECDDEGNLLEGVTLPEGRTKPFNYARIKIGDGEHNINELPFVKEVGEETPEDGEIFNDYENNKALTQFSHAEGSLTVASGLASHAEGFKTKALAQYAHAEGHNTTASGDRSHAEGISTTAEGHHSHAEGNNTKATGQNSHTEGTYTTAEGHHSHAEGYQSQAGGNASHAEGTRTRALNERAHAEGGETLASGRMSHAEGSLTVASGLASHAEGEQSTAEGQATHAEGFNTLAKQGAAHAEGWATNALGMYSHSEGCGTLTSQSAIAAHAEGYKTKATGEYSHAGGLRTKATAQAQTALGKYNKEDVDALLIIGNGTGDSESERKNAFVVKNDENGNGYAEVQTIGISPNSVVTKEYVDSAIGGIETVLDSIIAIQDSFIGGATE